MAHVVHHDLAPFLDLFSRMTDDQLARLTGVSPADVGRQRQEVHRIMDLLEPFEDLLERLDDEALVRLTEQTLDTVAFWRACCLPPRRLKRGRGTSDVATPANPKPEPARTPDARSTMPRSKPVPETAPEPMHDPEPDEDDDAFVLTIDEGEPAPTAQGGDEDEDDPMNWGDL